MALKARVISGRAKRLIPLAAALLLAALMAVPSSNTALAQAPPGAEITLVNEDEGFVERKKDGRFIARPVFDRKPASLYYGVRHPDSGDWLTAIYRVQGEREEAQGRLGVQLGLPLRGRPAGARTRSRRTCWSCWPGTRGSGELHTFHAVIPIHQPGGLWNKILGALDPGRWAKAFARWTIEGVHGTLCGVVEKASGEDAANCREEISVA